MNHEVLEKKTHTFFAAGRIQEFFFPVPCSEIILKYDAYDWSWTSLEDDQRDQFRNLERAFRIRDEQGLKVKPEWVLDWVVPLPRMPVTTRIMEYF